MARSAKGRTVTSAAATAAERRPGLPISMKYAISEFYRSHDLPLIELGRQALRNTQSAGARFDRELSRVLVHPGIEQLSLELI